MSERRPTQQADVEKNLIQTTLDNYFMGIQTRRLEREIGWFVASPGMLVGSISPESSFLTSSDERYILAHKMKGAIRTLNAQTLVAIKSVSLPRDMSDDGLQNFFEDYNKTPETTRRFGHVALNEPGFPLLRPIKTEVRGFFETDSSGITLAVEGVQHYLDEEDGLAKYPTEQEAIVDDFAVTSTAYSKYKDESFDAVMRWLKSQ